MAQNVDLFLRSGQTINLEFEHLFVHKTGNELHAIEFQPKKGAPQLVFADVSDVVAVLIHDGVDIRRVAACLGHTDAGFTLRVYSHLMAGGDDAVRRAAGKALNVVTVPGPYPPSGEMA